MRFPALIIITFLTTAVAMADLPPAPGYSYVTVGLRVEAAEDFPEYRFFLATPADIEELFVKKDQSASFGEGRGGVRRFATLIAVPRSSFPIAEDKLTSEDKKELERSISGLKITGAIKLAPHNFRGDVPYWETGNAFTDVYRIERDGTASLTATLLSAGIPEDWGLVPPARILVPFIAAGTLLSLAIIALGVWLIRRSRMKRN